MTLMFLEWYRTYTCIAFISLAPDAAQHDLCEDNKRSERPGGPLLVSLASLVEMFLSELDHFTEAKKVFEHPGRMLRVSGEEIHGIPFRLLICLLTVAINKLFFHRRFMQPEIE